jgi:hypothetical protein
MIYPHGGAKDIWRDGEGGAHEPQKSELRDWGAAVENAIDDVPEQALAAVEVASAAIVSEASQRAELARDTVIDQIATDYKVNDGTDTTGALAALTGMVAEETALVRDTLHIWEYDGAEWNDTGLSPLAFKVDISDGFKSGGAQLPSLNDGNGVELLGFDDNGRAILRLSQRSLDDLVASLGPKLLQSADIDFPAFVDADGVEILGFDGDGRARFAVSQNVANQVAAMLDFSELIQPEEVSRDIVVFGHSVAAAGSGIGPTLAALFPDRNVYTEGIGGQDGLPVFQRQGSQPVSGTFSGNAIPATGEVAVTDIVLLNGSGTRSIKVEVETSGGDWIHGTLAFKTGSVYGFTRTVGGSVESVPNPATVRVLTGLSGVELSEFDKMIQVWLPFRNDVADGVGDPIDGAFNPQTQMTYLAAAMERVSTNRVVILGDINGAADGTSGTKLRGVERSNKAVKAVYPENFIDVIELCDAYGLTEITTADDGRDYIKITSDFSSDGLHPSDEVGKPVMAQAAKDHIISKGW